MFKEICNKHEKYHQKIRDRPLVSHTEGLVCCKNVVLIPNKKTDRISDLFPKIRGRF